ncbi:lysis system i-spanin subunit Rz [Serratia ureilytica]|uniref:lysis system i-spanin subunit Rz n=1 Tax=Serratia ureilytica TaxID=300181 RepID=UPI00313AB12F
MKEKMREVSVLVKQYEFQFEILQSRQRKLAELDAYYTERMNEAEKKNTALRTQLASGHRRMLIPVQKECTNRSHPATRGMGHDGSIELTTDTGQRILSVREGIIRDQQKLMYLQHYIRVFCRRAQ